MGKTKSYSVRLQSLRSISKKAWLAKAFDGTEAIIPKSQVFGPDYEVTKSDAFWIAAWILEKKELQYSIKKPGWYNPATGMVEPVYQSQTTVEHHIPSPIKPVNSIPDASLTRPTT